MKLSKKGINWKGEELNESNIDSNTKIKYQDDIYITGNRRNKSVELFDSNNNFKMTVNMDDIYLVEL